MGGDHVIHTDRQADRPKKHNGRDLTIKRLGKARGSLWVSSCLAHACLTAGFPHGAVGKHALRQPAESLDCFMMSPMLQDFVIVTVVFFGGRVLPRKSRTGYKEVIKVNPGKKKKKKKNSQKMLLILIPPYRIEARVRHPIILLDTACHLPINAKHFLL